MERKIPWSVHTIGITAKQTYPARFAFQNRQDEEIGKAQDQGDAGTQDRPQSHFSKRRCSTVAERVESCLS
jgi:hypothetical protein